MSELELENRNAGEEAKKSSINFQNLQLELERKAKGIAFANSVDYSGVFPLVFFSHFLELSDKELTIVNLQTQTQKIESVLSKKDKEIEDLVQTHAEELMKIQFQQQQNLEKKSRENEALLYANKEYQRKIEAIEENERKLNQQKQIYETEKAELKELNENLLAKIKEHERNHQKYAILSQTRSER